MNKGEKVQMDNYAKKANKIYVNKESKAKNKITSASSTISISKSTASTSALKTPAKVTLLETSYSQMGLQTPVAQKRTFNDTNDFMGKFFFKKVNLQLNKILKYFRK